MSNKDYLYILKLFADATKTPLKELDRYKNYTIEF